MHLFNFLPPRGLYCLACAFAALTPLHAGTTASSVQRGFITTHLSMGNNAMALPLIASDLFTGVVSGNTTSLLTFASGDVATVVTPGRKYYVEVETGALEGERFDLDTGH